MSEQRPEESLEEQRETVIGQLTSMYLYLVDTRVYNETAWRALSPLLEQLLDIQLQLADESEV